MASAHYWGDGIFEAEWGRKRVFCGDSGKAGANLVQWAGFLSTFIRTLPGSCEERPPPLLHALSCFHYHYIYCLQAMVHAWRSAWGSPLFASMHESQGSNSSVAVGAFTREPSKSLSPYPFLLHYDLAGATNQRVGYILLLVDSPDTRIMSQIDPFL